MLLFCYTFIITQYCLGIKNILTCTCEYSTSASCPASFELFIDGLRALSSNIRVDSSLSLMNSGGSMNMKNKRIQMFVVTAIVIMMRGK